MFHHQGKCSGAEVRDCRTGSAGRPSPLVSEDNNSVSLHTSLASFLLNLSCRDLLWGKHRTSLVELVLAGKESNSFTQSAAAHPDLALSGGQAQLKTEKHSQIFLNSIYLQSRCDPVMITSTVMMSEKWNERLLRHTMFTMWWTNTQLTRIPFVTCPLIFSDTLIDNLGCNKHAISHLLFCVDITELHLTLIE